MIDIYSLQLFLPVLHCCFFFTCQTSIFRSSNEHILTQYTVCTDALQLREPRPDFMEQGAPLSTMQTAADIWESVMSYGSYGYMSNIWLPRTLKVYHEFSSALCPLSLPILPCEKWPDSCTLPWAVSLSPVNGLLECHRCPLLL